MNLTILTNSEVCVILRSLGLIPTSNEQCSNWAVTESSGWFMRTNDKQIRFMSNMCDIDYPISFAELLKGLERSITQLKTISYLPDDETIFLAGNFCTYIKSLCDQR